MHPEDKHVLDTAEGAKRAGLGKSTFEKLRLNGGGPTYLKIGRRVLYYAEDIDSWLSKHRRASTSESK